MRRRGGALVHTAGNLAPLVTGLVTAPLTARALGPDGRGEVVIIVLLSSAVITIGSLGLGWVAREEIARDRLSLGYWRRLARIASLIAILPTLAAAATIALVLQLGPAEVAGTFALLLLAAFAASRSVDGNIMVSTGKIGTLGAANLSYAIFVVVGTVCLFAIGELSVATALFVNAGGLAVQMTLLSIGIAHASRHTRSEIRSRQLELAESRSPREVIGMASRAWRAQLLDTAATRADSILVAIGAGAGGVGIYSIAGLIPQIAYALAATLTQRSFAVTPTLSAAARLRTLQQASVVVSLLFVAVSVPAAFFLIPTVFGDAFIESRGWLVPASSVAVGLSALAPLLVFQARDRSCRGIVVVAHVLTPMAVSLALLPASPALSILALGLGFFASGLIGTFVAVGRGSLMFDSQSFLKIVGLGKLG